MADEIPIFPKAGSILINTGSIVNWNRLKRKPNHTPTDELKECISATVGSWLNDLDKTKAQYATDLKCINPTFSSNLSGDDREQLKITVKIFVTQPDPLALEDAIEKVLADLDVTSLETVLLSLSQPDQKSVSMDGIKTLWEVLERMVEKEKILAIGISDLAKDELEQLHTWSTVKPCINHVNLASCCVMPPDLTEYAKEQDIQLLTHSDPKEMFPDKTFQDVLCSTATEKDSEGWSVSWIARYTALVKDRGIIKAKGYLVKAVRDVKKGK
ncbi:glutamate--cysteine ligase regulatory subunit [Lingula anatina]|uniref:GCS light chain n=1 Tax=Lingula anatina TaxID=7574 RepID=A0A1S3IL31_LINAN|nr:glutamate--cysteine ligase regulatory subunit [Lingula anatina]|eukprot:XP_013398229.1 glutamate--cysteine ligase regulatory subunit [Lingula anatina]